MEASLVEAPVTVDGPYVVRAVFEAPHGLRRGDVVYAVDDGPLEAVWMAEQAAGVYEGAIPGQDLGAVVTWYVAVQDTRGVRGRLPREAPTERFRFVVGQWEPPPAPDVLPADSAGDSQVSETGPVPLPTGP